VGGGDAEQAHVHGVAGALPQIVGDGELEIPFARHVWREGDRGRAADDAALSRVVGGGEDAPLVDQGTVVVVRPVVAGRAIQGDGGAVPLQDFLVQASVRVGYIGVVGDDQFGPQSRIGRILAGMKAAPVGVFLFPAGGVSQHQAVVGLFAPHPGPHQRAHIPGVPAGVHHDDAALGCAGVIRAPGHSSRAPGHIRALARVIAKRVVAGGTMLAAGVYR